VGGLHCSRPLGGHGRARDLPPHLESSPHLVTVFGSREEVTPRSEVLGDRPIGGEEPLRVSWRLEALHAPLPLAGRLVGVFRAVIQIPVLAMLHPRQQLLLRGAIAFQLVGDDHPRHVRQSLQQLTEELLGRFLVATTLHQDIEDVPVRVNGAPEVVPLAIDREEDFIQMPCVAGSGTPALELIGIGLPELQTPLSG
jgi:hypothetical protein